MQLALVPEARKKALGIDAAIEEVGMCEHEAVWVGEGELEITYIATTAGFNDL